MKMCPNSELYLQIFSRDNSSHVLSEDTICRELRDDGKLYSKRLLTKTNRVPKWGERFFKAKSVAIIEESVIDLDKRELVTYSRNIGFNKIMVSQLLYNLFIALL
jgi:PRELI-like family